MSDHSESPFLAKYYMEQRPATQKELDALKAKHPIQSRVFRGKYKQGWAYADDDGNRGTLAGKNGNIGSTKKVKAFSAEVGGEKVAKGYGVLAYYKRGLTPAARSIKTATGKLKPVLPSKPAKAEAKHKKPLQLGF